ncbi:hypothetical protein AB1L42_21115, partial [Thalassoglobus sp. JC818]|uniref:hypothetical protein n=1 Tax=Thalassoglobus sp. JC818 TaxID=3232136 RepID=UPI00345A3EEE
SSLSVVYKPKAGRQKKMASVDVRFLRFVNLGREPVRGTDIAPTQPFRVVVAGVQALDIAIAGVSREVTNIRIANDEYGNDQSSAQIEFDFLDYNDGGVVKIVTVGSGGSVNLEGVVIGMPEGIKPIDRLQIRGLRVAIGCAAVILELAAIASVPLIFFWVTGSWANVWLMILPFFAMYLPIVVLVMIWLIVTPDFPASLALPSWARQLGSTRFRASQMLDSSQIFLLYESRHRDEKPDGTESD